MPKDTGINARRLSFGNKNNPKNGCRSRKNAKDAKALFKAAISYFSRLSTVFSLSLTQSMKFISNDLSRSVNSENSTPMS